MRVMGIHTDRRGEWSRASAMVDGQELYFEAAGATLAASPEGFASALVPAAALCGKRIALNAPVDPDWLAGLGRLLRIWHQWWRTPARVGRVLTAAGTGPAAGPSGAAGPASLCFSLGVDSFYTLLRSGRRIDRLVFVEGFDIRLADTGRLAAVASSLAAVSAASGVPLIRIRTNLRDHPAYGRPGWSRSHGGALAAVGHFLGPGELLVSSTKAATSSGPWGSHWMTDPLWSSGTVRIAHVGAERRRAEKLGVMLEEPLVQRHLRVCWEHRGPGGNCGRCEKCLRTMLILNAHGRLDDFSVFAPAEPLAALAERIPAVPAALLPGYLRTLAALPAGPVRAAVERLVARSQPARPGGGARTIWNSLARGLGWGGGRAAKGTTT
jgi:hypothetical protein